MIDNLVLSKVIFSPSSQVIFLPLFPPFSPLPGRAGGETQLYTGLNRKRERVGKRGGGWGRARQGSVISKGKDSSKTVIESKLDGIHYI